MIERLDPFRSFNGGEVREFGDEVFVAGGSDLSLIGFLTIFVI